jgi:hypothetical protein
MKFSQPRSLRTRGVVKTLGELFVLENLLVLDHAAHSTGGGTFHSALSYSSDRPR